MPSNMGFGVRKHNANAEFHNCKTYSFVQPTLMRPAQVFKASKKTLSRTVAGRN